MCSLGLRFIQGRKAAYTRSDETSSGYGSLERAAFLAMGQSLAARGITSLAIDLPLHADRDDGLVAEARTNPLGLLQHWRMAPAEARVAIHFIGT